MLAASGCAGAPGSGVVKGTLVVRDLPDFLGNPVPKSGPVDGEVSAVQRTGVVTTLRVTGGSFALDLPAGTYTITGTTGGKSPLKCKAASPVTVTTSSTTSVEATCDAL